MSFDKNKIFGCPAGCKPMSGGVALALTALSATAAGAFPSNFGGMIFLAVAIGLFSYVLTASFKFIYVLMGAAIALAVAMLSGVSFSYCVVSLVYIPISFAMSQAIRRRAGLNAAVAVATMVTVALGAVGVGVCYFTMWDDLTAAVSGLWGQYVDMMHAGAAAMNSTAAGVVMSETLINELIHATLMTLPSMIVLLCMAMNYIAAKILKLAAAVGESNEMFPGCVWPVTASLAGSIVFIGAYIVTMFTYDSDIVYYSAINILYIILPSQAIVGFKLMFSRRSPIKSGRRWISFFIIALCVYFVFVSPIMLLMLAASFTAFYNIRIFFMRMKKDRENDDN